MDFKKMLLNFIKKVTVALLLLCMEVKERYLSISDMKSLL